MSGELFMLFVDCILDASNLPRMADWIQDNRMGHPEAELYVKRLMEWRSCKLSTATEAVAKFGDKKSRKLIRTEMRKIEKTKHLRSCRRTLRASNRKRSVKEWIKISSAQYKMFYVKIAGSYS